MAKATKKVYLLRHAQPVITAGRKAGLSRMGQQQAQQLAQRLSQVLVRADSLVLLHAPSLRCRQTAETVAETLGLQPSEAPLRFLDIEKLPEGDPQDTLQLYTSLQQLLDIESPADYAARFTQLMLAQPANTVIVVSNEVNIRTILIERVGQNYGGTVRHAAGYHFTLQPDGAIQDVQAI